MSDVRLILGDCLKVMGEIADGSIDLILTDLPYQVTACKWDVMIPFEPLWAHYRRILKPRRAVVLTSSQPFTTDAINSNRRWFKYCLVWDKKQSGSFHLARYSPLKIHEDIVVFGQSTIAYYPQMRTGRFRKRGGAMSRNQAILGGLRDGFENYGDQYFPTSIIEIPNERIGKLHPTQKPVALMEYLIRTYSHEGETVLDSCMGSGSTGIACVNTGRNFVGIELDPGFFETASRRIAETRSAMPLLASQS